MLTQSALDPCHVRTLVITRRSRAGSPARLRQGVGGRGRHPDGNGADRESRHLDPMGRRLHASSALHCRHRRRVFTGLFKRVQRSPGARGGSHRAARGAGDVTVGEVGVHPPHSPPPALTSPPPTAPPPPASGAVWCLRVLGRARDPLVLGGTVGSKLV